MLSAEAPSNGPERRERARTAGVAAANRRQKAGCGGNAAVVFFTGGADSNAYVPFVRRVAYALCLIVACATSQAAQLELQILDNQGAGLSDGVISVYPANKTFQPVSGNKAQIDQRGLKFVGQVLVVQTGTTVTFPNSDNVRHHVYSFSQPKTPGLKLYSGNHASSVVFDKPGVVPLGCNIHDWMLGYICVVDTPYFVKTDSNGRATLENLAEGDYELRVWHPQLESPREFISEHVILGATPVHRSFSITLHPPAQPNHPPEGLELGLEGRAHEHAD